MRKYVLFFSVFLVISAGAFVLARVDVPAAGAQEQVEPAAEGKTAKAEQTSNETVLVKKGELNLEAKNQLLQNTGGDYYMGNEYAPVLMIEYASLSCPHCAHFHETVLEDLIVSHVNTGKLRYIFRDFPLNAQALDASKLALCADKKNYFNFIKVLFKSQQNWAYNQDYRNTLKNIGSLGGIAEERFNQCMNDKSLEDKILKAQQQAAEILQVQSTPTIFINGIEYKGDRDYASVAAYIDNLLSNSSK